MSDRMPADSVWVRRIPDASCAERLGRDGSNGYDAGLPGGVQLGIGRIVREECLLNQTPVGGRCLFVVGVVRRVVLAPLAVVQPVAHLPKELLHIGRERRVLARLPSGQHSIVVGLQLRDEALDL